MCVERKLLAATRRVWRANHWDACVLCGVERKLLAATRRVQTSVIVAGHRGCGVCWMASTSIIFQLNASTLLITSDTTYGIKNMSLFTIGVCVRCWFGTHTHIHIHVHTHTSHTHTHTHTHTHAHTHIHIHIHIQYTLDTHTHIC